MDLMCRVRDGDLPAYRQLWERHHGSLTAFLTAKTRCPVTAEELAAETLWRIYRSRAAYQPTAKFTTWLYTVAGNLALNWRRNAARVRRCYGHPVTLDRNLADRLSTRLLNAEQQLLHRDSAIQLRAAINRLPPEQRRALLLHRYESLTYAGIAHRLNCSESAVKSLLFRAHRNLRRLFFVPA